VRDVRLEFTGGRSIAYTLDGERRELQPIPVGGMATRFVQIVILSTYPPRPSGGVEPRDFTPISEIEILGWSR